MQHEPAEQAAMSAVDPQPIDAHPPARPRLPINAQTWESLSLLHWEVPAEEVQALLPEGLIVDRYDGRTWFGVVPFVMSSVRVPPLPALGARSRFPELNARVYVHDFAGNRGVWFLSLWCSSAGFVASARALGLPYHRALSHARRAGAAETADAAAMADTAPMLGYRFLRSGSRLSESGVSFGAKVRALEPVDASSGLEAWLTARWNTFARRGGRLWRYPVHQEPWRLRAATAESLVTDLHGRFGFAPPRAAPLAHVAEPVHALVSRPRLCPRRPLAGRPTEP